MAKKRRKSFLIKTAEQLRVISSPIPFSIVQALQHLGPTAISDLGPKIGRSSNSLHYHMRKLLTLGMVRETGSRRSGARTEAIYDVVADRFMGSNLRKRPELKELANRSVGSLTRLASREFVRAADSSKNISEIGKERNMFAQRFTARLDGDQLAELNKCFDKIKEIFTSNIRSEEGQMCALTAVMVPLEITKK